jgi:hypothetical protein
MYDVPIERAARRLMQRRDSRDLMVNQKLFFQIQSSPFLRQELTPASTSS